MVEARTDLRFVLSDVDADPVCEAGMILLGLPPQLLLAGLGSCGSAADPGRIAMTVDRLRHASSATPGRPATSAMADAIAEGALRWRAARAALEIALPVLPASAAVRATFARCFEALGDMASPVIAGQAERAYIAVCWMRCYDVDRCAHQAVVDTSTSEGPW